ncbi:MAG: tRNA (N6-isopentenyl adenosine(37)-C2)-methylthiotransferase MiaB [Alphaproteobacteria bacterium]|nr:tRNA (N6-isopentenyl adenosine(37)-C2)-methylthiotransferase MiaB [Alphaproteobacteria bacterium]
MPKKLFIKTYGCQMNAYDSQRMMDVMAPHGFEPADSAENADLVILNTCHIREKAAEKVYSDLGRIRDIKRERGPAGAEMMVAVAGCVAQAEGDEILRRAPVVNMVFGPQAYHRLPEMLARAQRFNARGGRERPVDTDFAASEKFDALPESQQAPGVAAFLSVQEGCDKFCTYCVVPYTRGAEYSRPVAPILAEARRLVARGVREITLLGQNVNAYHGDGGADGKTCSLGQLIWRLAEIDGLARIRYTTSYPGEMDDDLISAHAEVEPLMPYLHLPVQSGSDRILDVMNRRHTVEFYLRLVERIRRARPGMALSSDFIVGFPGETDDEFKETLQLVRQVGFASAFSFKFSARPGTPAATMDGQVPEALKSERLLALQALLDTQRRAFNSGCVGRTLPVLFEKPGRHAGQITGRSPYLQPVFAEGDTALIGRIVRTQIIDAGSNSLHGNLHLQAKAAE